MAKQRTPATSPTLVERTLSTFLRWVVWCVAAGFAYSVVVVVVAGLRGPHIPAGFAARLIVYNTGNAMLLAAIVAAMILVPYAYIVWNRPQVRYFGEKTPWPTGLLRGAIVGVVLGIVLGLAWHG